LCAGRTLGFEVSFSPNTPGIKRVHGDPMVLEIPEVDHVGYRFTPAIVRNREGVGDDDIVSRPPSDMTKPIGGRLTTRLEVGIILTPEAIADELAT